MRLKLWLNIFWYIFFSYFRKVMNEPEAIKPMDPSPLLVPIISESFKRLTPEGAGGSLPLMALGFHPESLPRHHSAFAAVLSKRKYDNININGIAFDTSHI